MNTFIGGMTMFAVYASGHLKYVMVNLFNDFDLKTKFEHRRKSNIIGSITMESLADFQDLIFIKTHYELNTVFIC